MRQNCWFALATVLVSGCYTSHINEPATTLPSTGAATKFVVVDVIDPDPERMPNAADGTFTAMRRELVPRVEESGLAELALTPEDSGALPVGEPRFLVRFRAADYSNAVDSNGGRLALLMTCGFLILPCPFIGLVPSASQRIRTRWEARVYDITRVEPARVALEGSREVTVIWDTTSLTPILRKSYELTLSADLGVMNREETEQFERTVGSELATQLIAESLSDIATAIAGAR